MFIFMLSINFGLSCFLSLVDCGLFLLVSNFPLECPASLYEPPTNSNWVSDIYF